jgi:hypothetical protein
MLRADIEVISHANLQLFLCLSVHGNAEYLSAIIRSVYGENSLLLVHPDTSHEE